MSKDYARTRPAAKNRNTKRKKSTANNRALPRWLWALVGLTAGLSIAAIAFIVFRPVEENMASATAPVPIKTQAPGPQIPPQQEARFKFYDELRKVEVKPSEDSYKVEKPPESATAQYRYVIQAGSFRDRNDAERRKANLALLGVESTIQAVDLQGKGTRYRVQIGPAMSRKLAEKTMRQLADNDIDSFASRVES
ncbi:MAG: SPOR domain-containing protein [Oceanococcus sp.]